MSFPRLISRRWVILILVSLIFFLVYFHRVSSAVLAPYLMEAFKTSATGLGGMSSAYFYLYGLSQPLVGRLTDRWGSRKVIFRFTVIAGLGAFLFAVAPSLGFATLGRVLLGLGSAGVFVPTMKMLMLWFGTRAFSQMNGLLLAIGNLGAIAASTPFAWIIQRTDWRFTFFSICGLTLFFALLAYLFLQDQPPGTRDPEKNDPLHRPSTRMDWTIFKKPLLWMTIALFFFYGGPVSTFQGLWGYTYLIDIYHFDKIQAGNLIMFIALGAVLGTPPLIFLIERIFPISKRIPLSVLIFLQTLSLASLIIPAPFFSRLALGLIFFVMGAALTAAFSLLWTFLRERCPAERLGTVMGIVNAFGFLGTAMLQPLTGHLLDRVGKTGGAFPFPAYQQAFGLCLAFLFLAFILSLFLGKKGTTL